MRPSSAEQLPVSEALFGITDELQKFDCDVSTGGSMVFNVEEWQVAADVTSPN